MSVLEAIGSFEFHSAGFRYWNDNAGGVLVAELPVGTNEYTIPVGASA